MQRPTDDFGPNRGNVPSNAVTDDNILLIRGVHNNFAEGSALRLYDNEVYIGQATLNATGPGTWGSNTRPLTNGAHRFTLRIVNPVGVEIWESGGHQVTVNSPEPADLSVDTPVISLVDDDVWGGVFSDLAEDQITNDAQPTIIGTVSADVSGVTRIEMAIDGGLGLDTLIGELGDEILNGQGDIDLLFGNAGQDTLLGEGGDDSDLLTGGFANDLLVGDALADTLSAVGGDDELLAGFGNDTVYGGGSDSITGGAADGWLHGGTGNDWFFNTAGGQRLSGVDTLVGGAGDDTLNLQPLSWGRQVVSFDDVVANVGGRNVIQGVDQVNNFQGDQIDSSGQVINVGGVPVRGPAQNLADQLDLGGLFDQLGYAATAEARQGALDIRPTATTGLFEIWVDADATATEDFQMITRVQLTSGTIDLNENIILL